MLQAAVNISSLKSRFDVRYHTSGDAEIGESWPLSALRETIVRDPNCYGFNYSTYGVPLIRISDMKQPFIDFSRVERISAQVHQRFNKTHLQPYDILISVRGMSTGKVSIFLGEVPDANISPNIIIVRLKDVVLAPYVAMILISEIGQSQIKRFFSGGGKPSLTAPMIAKIQIPIPSDGRLQQINKLFEDARTERLHAQELRFEIESIFDIAFDEYRVNKSLSTVTGIKKLGQRWDAHFHNEGYVSLRSFLSERANNSIDIEKLSPLKSSTANNFDQKSKVEYIEIGSINNSTGIIDEPLVEYPDNLPNGAKIPILEGDILISKVRPYLNANVVFHSSNNSIQSVASKNAFAVLDSSQLHLKHYIGAFLRSHLGLSQIVMYQSGTSYPTVSDNDIAKVRVLYASTEQMEAINSKFKQYMDVKLVEEFTAKAILELIEDEIDSTGGIGDLQEDDASTNSE